MSSFKNIVLTTDFSKNAEIAIPYAVDLAREYKAKLYLVHVLQELSFLATTAEDAFSAATGGQIGWFANVKLAHQTMVETKAIDLTASTGIVVSPILRTGRPAHEIVSFTKELEEPCIVIATRGRSEIAHLLHGSVAERVIRISECPVIAIPTTAIKNKP